MKCRVCGSEPGWFVPGKFGLACIECGATKEVPVNQFIMLDKTRTQAEHRAKQARDGKIEIIKRALCDMHNVEVARVVVMTDRVGESEYAPAYWRADCQVHFPDSRIYYEFNAPTEIEALAKAASRLKSEAATVAKWRAIVQAKPS